MGRYFKMDIEVVQGDDQDISLTWATVSGTPVDVSAWDVYYKAEHNDPSITDTITVAPAAVTFSDSGTGTVDTFTISLTDTITTVDPGHYIQEIAIARSGLVETVARGTLTITERLTAVTP